MPRDDGGGGFHELFDSVRRSITFRPSAIPADEPAAYGGRIAERIGSRLRTSRGMGLLGLVSKSPSPPRRLLPPPAAGASAGGDRGEENPPIGWRKGELIGCGAFGQVYLGMNLNSGELLAVKQVLIGSSNAAREKAQAHIRELEEEVKLLKNLSHPNIVRYVGTVREDDSLNILLEFVPGGSIQSLLGKLGSFPEAVIRKYTKQLLQGLEYLHRNGIIHRDIKGANILVDNKGCIKLADFGASKQVAKLATATAAKTMKGTPYWMAPEIIVGSGHNFSADIWSVGCTVIEMATGKPPWSQQYQEVALLFHVGTTKSHPPIPEHLSPDAKDFLLKCLQKEPELRSAASELLQHPFVTEELKDLHPLIHAAHKETSSHEIPTDDMPIGDSGLNHSGNRSTVDSNISSGKLLWEGSRGDDICQFPDKEDFPIVGSSFNPMSEPFDDWESKFDVSPEERSSKSREFGGLAKHAESSMSKNDFTFPCDGSCEDDDEVTESKIKAFLDEKALDLKKLQTPLYEEFYNTVNAGISQGVTDVCKGNIINNTKLPPRGKSPPSKTGGGIVAALICDNLNNTSPETCSRRFSRSSIKSSRILREIASPRLNESEDTVHRDIQDGPSSSFFERQRKKWKEELDQELERQRIMRLAGCGKTPSPRVKS